MREGGHNSNDSTSLMKELKDVNNLLCTTALDICIAAPAAYFNIQHTLLPNLTF